MVTVVRDVKFGIRAALVMVASLALVGANLVLPAPDSAHASTQHTQTADCSKFSSRTITVAPGDTIVISSSNCTGIATVSSQFTTDPSGVWSSNQLNPTAGTATFPATITVDAKTSAKSFDLRLMLNTTGNWALQVNIASPPATPSNISGTVEDQQSTLKWSGNFNGANPYYEIQQSTDNQTWSPVAGTCASQVPASAAYNGCQVTGLSNGTPYFFRIRGVDNVGTSAWGVIASSVTPSLPPPAPTSVVGTAGNAQVSLSWTAPVMDSTYAAITGYKVEVKDGNTWSTSIPNTASTTTSATITKTNQSTYLVNGATYTFRVSAINGAGAGTASADSAGVTPFTVPDGVDGQSGVTTSLASGTTDTLNVSWTAPSDQGSPITEYEVQIAETPQAGKSPVFGAPTGGTCATANVTATSCTISGLTQGSSYLIQIRAQNQAGWSSYGNPHTATVPGPAGAPQNPTTTTGDGQVVFTWGLPTTWGGPTPTAGFSYDVEQSSNGGNSWTNAGTVTIPGPSFPSTSSVTITGLTNGTAYDFRVSAVTSYGNGAWATATSVTPSTVPGAPASVTATRGDTQVLLAWTAPASNGGSAITDYEYEVSTDGGSTYATPVAIGSAATSVTVSGLTNGTAYIFRVKTKNTNGLSVTGTVSNSATPVALPGTPSGLSATHGNGQVSLSWTPGGSVGTPLTGHLIEVSTDSGSNWTTAIADTGSSSGSATVTGLTNGTSYVFRVAGISSAGTGLPFTLASAVTPSTTPSAVTGLSAQVGDQQAVLTWTAGATGGSAITGYLIEQNDGTGWTQVTANTASSATTYTVTGLTNGTAYDFRVTPINTNGASLATAPTLANPVTPVAAPGVPAQPTAVAGPGSATITVAAGTGGAPTSFTITALDPNNQSAGTCTVTGASGSCTISGLTAGTAYTFTATATNANTTSAASTASAAVTPTAPPAPNPPAPNPPAPNPPAPSPVPIDVTPPTPAEPATGAAVVGGVPAQVAVAPVPAPAAPGAVANGAQAVVTVPGGLTGSGSQVSAAMTGPLLVDADGGYAGLQIIPGAPMTLALDGLAPGTLVGVYAMPSGQLLGSFPVDAAGRVSADPSITGDVGLATSLQLAGELPSGETVNVAVSVTVLPEAAPVPEPGGDLPAPAPGGAYVTVDGVAVPAEPDRTESQMSVVEEGALVQAGTRSPTQSQIPLDSQGALRVVAAGSVEVTGSGMTGWVDVFAFSEPIFLGRLKVYGDGSFTGLLPVPPGLPDGRHTLQMVGTASSGREVSAALPMVKSSPQEPSRQRIRILFDRGSLTLSSADAKRLGGFASGLISATSIVSRYNGSGSPAQVKAAKARAQAVVRHLRTLRPGIPVVVSARQASRSAWPGRSIRVITTMPPTQPRALPWEFAVP